MRRGQIWWASLPAPVGSEPGFRRPILIVSANEFNQSNISTIIAAVITSNLRLAAAPGNLLLKAKDSGLPKDSVVNVSQIITIDKASLLEHVGSLGGQTLRDVEAGLRLVLGMTFQH